ncbi:MAG: hypothetical protein GYB41_10675 [Oceanospirillales bacterium]|uniref:Uncharacterized protein (TIGR02001 family) n=1 Tax=Marinobacterium halophilum TaxID=267374 RepID=A0A2P8EN34_9GAMM|nr:TorF family putative porin [Marinobacterium halophilum]MBR9829092.1 hypothetical protein [Oceanospirillales bacterium]PSL10858.1 uncharacterized protein (TIGR02001 family) [Marinobacterium halophilum]
MNTLTKHLIAAGLMTASAAASAELSVNIGAMSDYYFRGVDQTADNASLMAGADYDFENGFYIGTWGAQLDDSEQEYDLYGGYGSEYEGFSYGIGYAGYFYTADGATDFHELIFSGGYGPISAEYVLGTEDAESGDEADYSFFSLTGEYEGAYLTYGSFGKDYDGDYVEAGYGINYQGVDLSLAYINQLDDLSGDGKKDKAFVFTLSKTFNL